MRTVYTSTPKWRFRGGDSASDGRVALTWKNIARVCAVLLPSDILMDLLDQTATSDGPMIFSLQRAGVEEGVRVVCGVLEFTAPSGSVYVPRWVLERLNAPAGSLLDVRLTKLERGTFARIQPETDALQDQPDARVALEHALAAYMALSTGDRIPVLLPGHVVEWVRVVELKPAPAVCILNTDLRLELDEPLGGVRDTSVLRVNGEATQGTVERGKTAFYRFVAPKPSNVFTRKVRTGGGDFAGALETDDSPVRRAGACSGCVGGCTCRIM